MATIAEALRQAEAWLDELEGVEGVALGKAGTEDCITVFASSEEAAAKIPARLLGFRVVVEHTGSFHAQTS